MNIRPEFRKNLNKISLAIFRNGESKLPERAVIMGKGRGRIAVQHPEFPEETIVKFTKPFNQEISEPLTRGYVQNAVECHLTENKSPLSGYLLPVLASPENHNRWILTHYTDGVSKHDSDLKRAQGELNEQGIINTDHFASTNWGRWKEQPYLIDYGYVHPSHHNKLVETVSENAIWKRHSKLTKEWAEENGYDQIT